MDLDRLRASVAARVAGAPPLQMSVFSMWQASLEALEQIHALMEHRDDERHVPSQEERKMMLALHDSQLQIVVGETASGWWPLAMASKQRWTGRDPTDKLDAG